MVRMTCTSWPGNDATADRAVSASAAASSSLEITAVCAPESFTVRASRSQVPSQLGSRRPAHVVFRRSMVAAKCSVRFCSG